MLSSVLTLTTLAVSSHVVVQGHSILESIRTDNPISGILPGTTQHETFAPPRYITAESNRSIPTNAWWANLIHAPPEDLDYEGIDPVWANPFAIQVVRVINSVTTHVGLHVNYPADHRILSTEPSGNNVEGAIKSYTHELPSDVILSAVELESNFNFEISDWDNFGVTTVFSPAGADADVSSMTSVLVNGMAFVTASYVNMMPTVFSATGMKSINGEVPAVGGTYSTTAESSMTLENADQTWIVYTDEPLTFSYDANVGLVATTSYTGDLRVTRIADAALMDDFTPYIGCVVEGATLVAESTDVEYGYDWKTRGNCENGFLHYALSHHEQSLILSEGSVSILPDLQGSSATRGPMHAVVVTGETFSWRLSEPDEIPMDFYPQTELDPALAAEYDMAGLLTLEIEQEWLVEQGGSYYFTGKKLQLYASMCLMASDPNVGLSEELQQTCLTKLRTAMEYFLTNTWTFPLAYDEVYHGVISTQSFVANDPWIDFGNTMYNDHHYHYGYYIVAGSIQKMLDPTWERMAELELMVETLIRDVANPNEAQDPHFPEFRHFDWYLGHSYSHGLSPFADGKDQESTSEDANLDYGLMLWGIVNENANLEALGKLMLKVNSRAIQNYFLMSDDNVVHPEECIKNKVTGIFFDNKIDYATWFSAEIYAIHGIQMIPVSPITEVFRTTTFVTQEWEQVLSKVDIVANVGTVEDPWQSLLFTNYAAVDKKAAMDALAFVPMDDGLTRPWALYMAATRS